MTHYRTLDIVTSWMLGCNSSEDCDICDSKRGDGSGFNVHFVFPLSLSSHLLFHTCFTVPDDSKQPACYHRPKSYFKYIFDISPSWIKSKKIFILKKLLVLGPLLHTLYLIYDFGFWDFHIIILNDSWPCTDDSLCEIRPTVSYTDM